MAVQEKLKTLLLSLPTARLGSGGKEVIMRCDCCGDAKDPRSAHMYISLGHNDLPLLWHCFKCHAKGILNHARLMQLTRRQFDVDTGIEVIQHNNRVMSLEKNRKFKDSEVYRLDNNFISMSDTSNSKLQYINNRLGLSLTYQDIIDKKIVLNLGDVLENNKIYNYSRDIQIVQQLDELYLGFISQDNAFVNLRRLVDEGRVHKSIDKRYINYNIFNKFENTERYYTIPTSIDLANPKRIKLNVSEGPFDILSIFYNVRKQEDHSIYSAVCGSGFLGIIKHFIYTMKLINIELHIYKDNDMEDSVLLNLRDIAVTYDIPFYIHKNIYEGEKDFGVKIDKIQEQIIRVY